jgi:hypothetical protein
VCALRAADADRKSELGIRPIYHPSGHRADAHIQIAILAYCLQIIVKYRLVRTAVREKLADIQMIRGLGVQLEVRVRGPVEPDSKGSILVDSPA